MSSKYRLYVLFIAMLTTILLSVLISSRTEADTIDCNILVFSKTAGFRHGSISDGIIAITETAPDAGLTVDFTEDANAFTLANLSNYAAVVFLNTSGDILDSTQEAAFENYIRAGNGFTGVHAASDTEYDWVWYDSLLGTHFQNHPARQDATLTIVDQTHISTSHLDTTWMRFDEWYNFQSQPVGVTTLITIDESSYSGGSMGDPHPIAWYQFYDGGRSWYTAMGHTSATYQDSDFRQHLINGIVWSADAETCNDVPLNVGLQSLKIDFVQSSTLIVISITCLLMGTLYLRRLS